MFIRKLQRLQQHVTLRSICVTIAIIIVLLLGFRLFQNFINQYVLDAMLQTTRDISEKTENLTEYSIEIAKNFCFFIYNDPNVSDLRTKDNLTKSESTILLRKLNNFVTSGSYIDSVYIYNGKMDYIFTTSREGNSPASFFDQDAVSLLRSRDMIQSLQPILRDYESISTQTAVSQIYSFVVFERDFDGQPKDNAIIVNVTPAWYNMFFSVQSTQHPSFFVDSNLNIIAASSKKDVIPYMEDLSSELFNDIQDGSLYGYVTVQQPKADTPVCFYAKTGLHDWYYLVVDTYGNMFPYLVSFEKITDAVFKIFIATLILLLVLFVIPFLQIRMSIAKVNSTEIGINTESTMDKLNRLIQLSINSRQINEAISVMMKEEIIRSFLYGSAQSMSPETIIREYSLALDPVRPMKVILVTNGMRNKEYVEEVRQVWPLTEGVLMSGDHCVLLTIPSETRSVQEVLQVLHNRFGPHRRYVISTPITDWYDLHTVYENLRKVSLLFSLHSGSYYIDCESLTASTPIPDNELHREVKNILSTLKSGKFPETVDLYSDYMIKFTHSGLENAIHSVSYLKRQCEATLREVNPTGKNQKPFTTENIESWLRQMGSSEAVDRYFLGLFEEIFSFVAGEKQARALQQANSVISLIKSEYKDYSLSAQTIADKLDLSCAYLNRTFKQATGQSISSYITYTRLEEARLLLLQEDVRIKAIPYLVGLENQQYFFVLFKKKYGETPGQYRKRVLDLPEDSQQDEDFQAEDEEQP